MTLVWGSLPFDISTLILAHLASSLVGYSGPDKRSFSKPKDQHAHILELALLQKAFATSLQPILDLYSTPYEDNHAERFIGATLKFIFGPHLRPNLDITNDAHAFLYMRVYESCTRTSMGGCRLLKTASRYYSLLSRMLTDLLRTRALPWKGLDAVRDKEMRLLLNIFKYIDRYFVTQFHLDALSVCMERAYLDGDPRKTKPPAYSRLPITCLRPPLLSLGEMREGLWM